MGAPTGNKNASRKTRMLANALTRELTQNPEEVVAVARKLLDAAKAGEAWAQSMIWDRVDGKLAQSIIGGDEDDPAVNVVAEITIRAVDANRPTQESG